MVWGIFPTYADKLDANLVGVVKPGLWGRLESGKAESRKQKAEGGQDLTIVERLFSGCLAVAEQWCFGVKGMEDTALFGDWLRRRVMSPDLAKSAGLTKAGDIVPLFKERMNPRISEGTV